MLNRKVVGKIRPNPTIFEIIQINDKVLHDVWEHYKERIYHVINSNLSIEDAQVSLGDD